MTKIGYKLSSDYDRLQELLDKGFSVVCIVEMRVDKISRNIVCEGFLENKGVENFEHYVIRSGSTVITQFNQSLVGTMKNYPFTFADAMKNWNVSFIDFID